MENSFENVLNSITTPIHSVGMLEVRKLSVAREKLCMMFEFDTINEILENRLDLISHDLESCKYEPVLMCGDNIALKSDGETQSVLLKDVIITGSIPNEKANAWAFMSPSETEIRSINLLCLYGMLKSANTTGIASDSRKHKAIVAVTEDGQVALSSDGDYTIDGFLDKLVEIEMLGEIEVDLTRMIARTAHLECGCFYTKNKRYVIIEATANNISHKHSMKRSWKIIYDLEEKRPIFNEVYRDIMTLNGIHGIFNGLYSVSINNRDTSGLNNKSTREVIDLFGKEGDKEVVKSLMVCDYFNVLDGYYCQVMDRNRLSILKFNPESREFEELPIINDDTVCTMRDGMIHVVEANWFRNESKKLCSILAKDASKSIEELVAEGDVLIYYKN